MSRILPILALLSSLLLLSCAKEEAAAVAPRSGTPVVIISIDTLRADRLPAYGYRGVETPAFDAFRRDAILFRNAWSHAPMTLPSHASLLTGLLPTQHGVRNNLGYTFNGEAHPTIARVLKRSGYETGAAISAYVLRGSTGFGAEFDTYDDAISARADASVGELSRDGNATAAVANDWIAAHAQRPFLYFLHLFEPHTPYAAPEPFASRYAAKPYDAEVAASDAILGRFLEGLKKQGVYDRALIIVVSDHGEGLGDHGESEHGVFLYREAIQVPLLVKLPQNERAGSEVTANVQLVDVVPTIAAVTGAEIPADLPGVSLLGTISDDRVIYSETFLPRVHFGWSELQSAIRGRHHHIRAPRPELYDLVADPGERTNVLEEQRRVYAALREELDRIGTVAQAPAAVSGEEAEKLAALGYIGSMREEGSADLPDPKDRIGDLELMRQASRMEAAGRPAEAERLYRQLVEANPRFTDAWARLAAFYETAGEPVRAEEAYKRAISSAPSLAPGFALSLGSLQLRMRKFDEAAAHANLALTRPSAAAGAHLLLARIAVARGDFAAADREARLAAVDASRRREASVVAAQVRTAQGRLGEALQILDGAKRESGAEPVPDLESARGDVLARMNRAQDAERAFRAEIAAFPNNREAYTRLAVLLVAMDRAGEAARVLEQMFVSNRSRATATLIAETWRAVENESAARRWEQRAAQLR